MNKRKRRRTKKDSNGKVFMCNICNKSYFSYPALYTHKRNKHNIIPITGKEEIFKNIMQKTQTTKFKYSALENDNWNFSDLLENIIKSYKRALRRIFLNPNCILFSPKFQEDTHIGIQMLKNIKNSKTTKLLVPDPSTNPCIDEILIIYLIYFVKVTQDQILIDLVVNYAILLREHINIVGWDYKRRFKDYGIKMTFNYQGPYSMYNTCEEVPDFVNDFISVFIPLDQNFGLCVKDIIDLVKNFCNWLFVNNLTSLKICSNEVEENENE